MTKKQWLKQVKKLGWWPAYSHYLSSPSWKSKRSKRLKIDRYECRTCGSKEDLQVHHKPKAYEIIPNESVKDDLVTLCEICHMAITNSIRERRFKGRDMKLFYQVRSDAVRFS